MRKTPQEPPFPPAPRPLPHPYHHAPNLHSWPINTEPPALLRQAVSNREFGKVWHQNVSPTAPCRQDLSLVVDISVLQRVSRAISTRGYVAHSSLPLSLSLTVSRCGLAVRRLVGKQKNLGSIRFGSAFSSSLQRLWFMDIPL